MDQQSSPDHRVLWDHLGHTLGDWLPKASPNASKMIQNDTPGPPLEHFSKKGRYFYISVTFWSPFGSPFGPSWPLLGPFGSCLDPLGSVSGSLWGHFGVSWAIVGTMMLKSQVL